jgi:hypothetical protein
MVVSLIARGEKITEQEAILSFYNTKLAQAFDSEDNLLNKMSPYFIYELWKSEKKTGDYLNSPYLDALI